MKEGQKRITFQLSKEERDRLAEEAARLEISISEIVRRAIKQFFGD